MHFLLSTMSVVYVLTTPMPEDGKNAIVEHIRKRSKWDNDDYVCRGIILNDMFDSLFDIYQNVESVKELWDSLKAKYMTDDASSNKYLHTLKYKNEELTLIELGSHLRIEESLRVQDSDKPKDNNVIGPSVVNMVEHNNSGIANVEKLVTKLMVQAQMNDDVACSGKIVFLFNVFHVPNIRNNLVSSSALNNCGYKQVIESDKFVLSKHGLSQWFWGEAMEVVRLPDPKLKIMGERGIEYIFVVYAEHSKVFRFYVIEPNESVSINSIIESRDAIFDENRFSSVPRPKAINDEIDSIMGNNTWVLADLPPVGKLMGCKWIFKKKMKANGTIEKFKARLVIQGFKQKLRIYYFDSYAPVACIITIRLLIVLASIHNLIIHQMDVKTAFLNGKADEEFYMNQPQDFIMPGNESKVCKLIKSLYGLKQAPKQWYQNFDEVVLSSGYLLNQAEKCVYSKFDESSK
ncbi:zinc finger, CCHC-type containing protein [Tanacetum coccineum]